MKQGRTIADFAAELQRQSAVKKDYLASSDAIQMTVQDENIKLSLDGMQSTFNIMELAHLQISEYTGIPYKYYTRMLSNPDLLVHNVNHWLHTEESVQKKRMVRTLDGSVRAFLSDRYRRIDNAQIAEWVLPIIGQLQDARIESCEVTDTRMYIKVVNPRLSRDLSVGDTVQSGIIISNSEVGLGSVLVAPLIYRLVCSNGMIAEDSRVKKYHIGRVQDSDENMEVYQDDTLKADDAALMLKLRDTVSAVVSEVVFAKIVDNMRESKNAKIDAVSAVKVVELTSQAVGIAKTEADGILGHLIAGGDLSLYGLGNAVTRYAQDVTSYDRSTELESIGYKVMTLPSRKWAAITSEASKASV